MTKIVADFTRPVTVDIKIPLVNEEGKFEDFDLEMTIRLVKGKEGDKYFGNSEDVKIMDVLKKHIVQQPHIFKDGTSKPYTLIQLMDVTYIRDLMFARLLEVSTNPMAAKGN